MDLSAALKMLAEQAVNAAGIKPVRPPAEPDHVYLTVDAQGGLHRNEATPHPRSHTAADLSAIIAFATANADSEVYYNRQAVTCLLDGATRRDRITLPLTLSPQLAAIVRWGACLTTNQPDLIHLLRTTFARCMPSCPFLLPSIRKLSFEAGGKTTSEVQSGKQSMSKQQLAQVTGEAELRDQFDLTVPIFDGVFPQLLGTITVNLDADGAKQQFRLAPIPGDVEAAVRAAEVEIGKMLESALTNDAKIYYGAV